MNIEEVTRSEYENHGTSWTRNEFFDTNGYLIIKNLLFILQEFLFLRCELELPSY